MDFSTELRRFLFNNGLGAYVRFSEFLVEFIGLVLVAFVLTRIAASLLRKRNYTNSEVLAVIPAFALYGLVRFYMLAWKGLSPRRTFFADLVLFALALGVCWAIQERREEKRERIKEYQARKLMEPEDREKARALE